MRHPALAATATLLLMTLLAPAALADYDNPPAWDSRPGFTHQGWAYLDPNVPLAPDGNVTNAYGSPEFLDIYLGFDPLNDANMDPMHAPVDDIMGWLDDPSPVFGPTSRRGMWGGMSPVIFGAPVAPDTVGIRQTFRIPSAAGPEATEVWLQMIYMADHAADVDGNTVAFDFAADANFDAPLSPTMLSKTVEKLPEGSGSTTSWYRQTRTYRFDTQPGTFFTRFEQVFGGGSAVVMDRFDVDTVTVPEPATALLLAVPAAAILRHRR